MESSARTAITDGLIDNFCADRLNVYVYDTRANMGAAAAGVVADEIRGLVESRGRAVGIFASAPSQNEVVAALVESSVADLARGVRIHLDVELAIDGPA